MRTYDICIEMLNGTTFSGRVDSAEPADEIAARVGHEGYMANSNSERADYYAASQIKKVTVAAVLDRR